MTELVLQQQATDWGSMGFFSPGTVDRSDPRFLLLCNHLHYTWDDVTQSQQLSSLISNTDKIQLCLDAMKITEHHCCEYIDEVVATFGHHTLLRVLNKHVRL